jgi:adenine deaminase
VDNFCDLHPLKRREQSNTNPFFVEPHHHTYIACFPPSNRRGIMTSTTTTTTLIKNGTIVNADFTQKADLLVGDNGKILKIASHIASEDLVQPAAREIDATGKFVLPGGIDPHVHLELSFMGQYSEPPESGTRCAIAGGTVRSQFLSCCFTHTERVT